MTTILSIQSSVAYGHVGNSAATFPLMRLGVEVWPVLTVHFSNNTSYPSKRGPLLAPSDVAEVVTGIDELGVHPLYDAVHHGEEAVSDIAGVGGVLAWIVNTLASAALGLVVGAIIVAAQLGITRLFAKRSATA